MNGTRPPPDRKRVAGIVLCLVILAVALEYRHRARTAERAARRLAACCAALTAEVDRASRFASSSEFLVKGLAAGDVRTLASAADRMLDVLGDAPRIIADRNVPVRARRFFKKRPDLDARVRALVRKADEAAARGRDVHPIQRALVEVLAQAAQGNARTVVAVLEKAEKQAADLPMAPAHDRFENDQEADDVAGLAAVLLLRTEDPARRLRGALAETWPVIDKLRSLAMSAWARGRFQDALWFARQAARLLGVAGAPPSRPPAQHAAEILPRAGAPISSDLPGPPVDAVIESGKRLIASAGIPPDGRDLAAGLLDFAESAAGAGRAADARTAALAGMNMLGLTDAAVARLGVQEKTSEAPDDKERSPAKIQAAREPAGGKVAP